MGYTHVIHWWAKRRDAPGLTVHEKFHIMCNRLFAEGKFGGSVVHLAFDRDCPERAREYVRDAACDSFGNACLAESENSASGELRCMTDVLFGKINSGEPFFYSHFKGMSYPEGSGKYMSALFWSYLMYKYGADPAEAEKAFSGGSLMHGAFLKRGGAGKLRRHCGIVGRTVCRGIADRFEECSSDLHGESCYYSGTFFHVDSPEYVRFLERGVPGSARFGVSATPGPDFGDGSVDSRDIPEMLFSGLIPADRKSDSRSVRGLGYRFEDNLTCDTEADRADFMKILKESGK